MVLTRNIKILNKCNKYNFYHCSTLLCYLKLVITGIKKDRLVSLKTSDDDLRTQQKHSRKYISISKRLIHFYTYLLSESVYLTTQSTVQILYREMIR